MIKRITSKFDMMPLVRFINIIPFRDQALVGKV